MTMLHDATHRAVRYFARSLAACVLLFAGAAWAQSGEPIKIGYGISQTGGLAPNGKSALLAQKIWEEDVNAKGGLLGRPVKLIYYDDQTNPATVPGIYTKLLDVDKVDLIIGGYGTNMLAPAMPVVIQKKKMLIGLFGLAVNSEFHYPQLLRDDSVRADPEDGLHPGLLRHCRGAESEAADGGDRRRRRRVLRQRLRGCPRQRQGGRAQGRIRQALSAIDHRLRADRSRGPGDQSGYRGDLLVPAGFGRHGEGDQRDRLQAEDDRRRLGWPAGDRHQDPARTVAQRL